MSEIGVIYFNDHNIWLWYRVYVNKSQLMNFANMLHHVLNSFLLELGVLSKNHCGICSTDSFSLNTCSQDIMYNSNSHMTVVWIWILTGFCLIVVHLSLENIKMNLNFSGPTRQQDIDTEIIFLIIPELTVRVK